MKKFDLKWTAPIVLALTATTAGALTPPGDSALHQQGPTHRFCRTAQHMNAPVHPAEVQMLPGTAPMPETPMRITAAGTPLYGYLTAGRGGNSHGLYEFNPSGFSLLWRDPLFSMDNGYATLNTSWLRDDKICGFVDWWMYGYFWGQTYYELDFYNGTLDTELNDEDCIDVGWFISACYDPTTDTVYGYGTDDEEGETAMFMKTSGADHFAYEIVKDYGYSQAGFNMQCLSMCCNPMDHKLYGINLNKQFVTIDKATGAQTVLFNVPQSVNMGLYCTGMAYSASEGVYYWNANYDNTDGSWGSDLYTIDPRTGTFTVVDSYEGGESFGGLFIVGETVNAGAPLRAELTGTDFADGATSGTVTYKMPTYSSSGAELSGTLEWALNLDGGSYKNGTATPGATVNVTVENLAPGNHTFAMTVSQNGNTSAETKDVLYIGADRPKAPASVIVDGNTLHWASVTEGEHGGYMNLENMEYQVYLNGQLLGTTKRTSMAITYPEGAQFQRWQAYVVAVCDGMRSNPAYSESFTGGSAWQLPVDIACTEEMLSLMTIVNVNNDDETWEYTDWDNGWYSGQSDKGQSDDWIILPPVHFPDASRYYSFYMDCMKKANIHPDTWLEVYYGDYPNPEMMKSNVIMERFSPQSRDYKEYGNPMFRVPEAGDYYIGIRCITNQDNLGCIIGNIRVEDNSISPESPAAPTNVVATPGANGALEATVTFNMPTKTVKGNDIPAATALTAVVTGDTEATLNGTPGQEMTCTVRTVQGDNTITIVVNNGDVAGERALVDVYTGVTIPGSVKNLTGEVSADMTSILMSWDAPGPENYKGYVDPATVDYYFCVKNPYTGNFDKTLAGTGITSGTFTLPETWTQDVYQVGISTENAAGNNGRIMAMQVQMGAPWRLTLKEDFENGEFNYQPWISYTTESSQVNWGMYMLKDVATEWAGLYTIALVGYTRNENTDDEGMLGMPRFTTDNAETVTVRIKYWAGDQATNIKILGSSYGMDTSVPVINCSLSNQDEWRTAEATLPAELLHAPWVQLYIDATFGQGKNYCIIEEIEVFDGDNAVIMNFTPQGVVRGMKGAIMADGFAGQDITVYDMAGARVAHTTGSDTAATIALPAGIYSVTAGTRTFKVVVR